MTSRPKLRACLIALAVVAGGACKSNNSGDTEQASKDVRKAQDDFNAQRDVVAHQAGDVAKQQQVLDNQDQKLDVIETDLAKAHAAYASAIQLRFAKLDTSLAELANKTDAKSKDAYTGLRARRDELAAKLATMSTTADTGWTVYTKDVDTTFDAIERDLGDARK